MNKPATAGEILTEGRLRAYMKCSQFFSYGGEELPQLETRMAQYATEYWMSASIRSPERDRAYKLSRALLQASRACELDAKYLAGQTEKYTNQATLWMDEFLELFPAKTYVPVSGPIPLRMQVSKTPFDLHVSGVFRTKKNASLHVLNFTPYKNKHGHINDPIVHMKMHALKGFVRAFGKRPQTVVHFLWSTKTGKLGYNRIDSEQVNPEYLDVIKQLVKQIETGVAYPLLPCNYNCPFKNKCFPGAANA